MVTSVLGKRVWGEDVLTTPSKRTRKRVASKEEQGIEIYDSIVLESPEGVKEDEKKENKRPLSKREPLSPLSKKITSRRDPLSPLSKVNSSNRITKPLGM
jgi:hypothetical protein